MDIHIRGGYAGGPRRKDDGRAGPAVRRSHMEIAHQRMRSRRRTERRRRRARLAGTALAAVGAAFGLGFALGAMDAGPDKAVTVGARPAQGPIEDALAREVSRALLELWRMEDVEAMRGRGR